MSCTYVTGFWKLDKNTRHDMSYYYKLIPRLFNKLRNRNIVFFYEDDEILEYIKSVCKTEHFISIKLLLTDLPTYDLSAYYLESCKRQDKRILNKQFEKGARRYRIDYLKNGEDNYRKLITIWTSKLYLIKRIIESNPFNSDIFVWTDIGITKRPIQIRNLNYDMSKVHTNRPPNIITFMNKPLKIAAGFIISGKMSWLKFISLYEYKLEELKESNYAYDEESIMALIYRENKSLIDNKVKTNIN
jgi:hypothetical protein